MFSRIRQSVQDKDSGFTLIELLVVMIIIGILAGGMMMVMGSSTDKAGATRAMSDLRTMASATLQYYADKGNNAASPDLAALGAFNNKTLTDTEYGVGYSGDQVWVGVAVPTNSRAKFLEIANNENIVVIGNASGGSPVAALGVEPYDNHAFAYMRAR